MNSFLSELVWVAAAAAGITLALAATARYAWRRGKALEEP